MRHLFSSRVEIYEPGIQIVAGAREMSWSKVNATFDSFLDVPGEMMCRLDLTFLRPGKDAPPAYQAGVALDRVGLLFCSMTSQLKAGQVIKTILGPVAGNFQIKSVPDIAQDFSSAHHIEVQIFEVNQSTIAFPGKVPES